MKDRAGILLHEMLFAPFFTGAAGTGHVWFWREAIDRPNFWYHFERFNRALAGIDPAAEAFEPLQLEHPQVRIRRLPVYGSTVLRSIAISLIVAASTGTAARAFGPISEKTPATYTRCDSPA